MWGWLSANLQKLGVDVPFSSQQYITGQATGVPLGYFNTQMNPSECIL